MIEKTFENMTLQEKKNSQDGLNRFERMETTHPRQYKIIMDVWGFRAALKELEEMDGVDPDYSVLGFTERSYQMPLFQGGC